MRVYLAGPIHGCTDDDVLAWRTIITNELRGVAECVDPTQWDFRGKEDENFREIVERDKAAIATCDAIIAYVWKPSAGTSMEVYLADQLELPCVVIAPKNVSPWIRYHATLVVDTGEAAVAEIIRLTTPPLVGATDNPEESRK
jgi:nucleoside 2-deoxyribosyltransferase